MSVAITCIWLASSGVIGVNKNDKSFDGSFTECAATEIYDQPNLTGKITMK